MILNFNKLNTKSNLSVCVVDNSGAFYISIAKRLSESFNRTYYYSVNQSPFPRQALDQVGKGYDSIIKIDEFWSSLDLFDIIVFPDIYFNDWGSVLRKMGKLVWGGCESEILETNRKVFKTEMVDVGMPVPPTQYVTGVTELEKVLTPLKDKWIKISYYRGELETFHHIDIQHTKQWLIEISYKMGPLSETMEFLIEDPIESIAETGCDGWCVNGNYPDQMIWGVEIKDMGYIGKRSNYNELPVPVKEVNDKFKPVLQKYKHTGFYSTEIRYTKEGVAYYTDACMRAGSPPSNTYMAMIDNWDEIISEGCKGNLVSPNFIAEYGVEIMLKSAHCNEGYLNISYPMEYGENIKLKGSFKVEDEEYVIPFPQAAFDMEEFGSVVVVGNNLEEIINKAMDIAGSIEGYRVQYNMAALSEAIERLSALQDALKIKF